MPSKTPAKGKTPSKARKAKDASTKAAFSLASPAVGVIGAILAVAVAVMLSLGDQTMLTRLRSSFVGIPSGDDATTSPVPPPATSSPPAPSPPATPTGNQEPASLGDAETARLIASVLPRRSSMGRESSEGGVADHDLSRGDAEALASLPGGDTRVVSSPVMLNTANFADALDGRVGIVLFRSVATKRIKGVRDAISRSFQLMPPGAVTLFGEVDVKSDSLLRIRYAPGIEYAGRGDSRKKGDRKLRDRDGEGYEFGRKRMLLRQMQITVFRGLVPVGVFRDAATPSNIAAFASSVALTQGHVARLSKDSARAWLATADASRPVLIACSNRDEVETVKSLKSIAKVGGSSPGGGSNAVVKDRRARIGYIPDERECADVLGWRAPPGGGREARIFVDAIAKFPAKEADATTMPLSRAGEALDDIAGVAIARVSWENEYDSFVSDAAPMHYKPLVVMLRPAFDSTLGGKVGADAIAANEAAFRAAARTLPLARRRMAHWVVADIDKYRGYLYKPCGRGDECDEAFVVVYIFPGEDDVSAGAYLAKLDTDAEREEESIAESVLLIDEASSGGGEGKSSFDSSELARKVGVLIDASAVMIGGMERAAARVDELDARSSILEQDGRRIQADDDEDADDDDEDDEEGTDDEKDSEGKPVPKKKIDPDEFEFETLHDPDGKKGSASSRMSRVVFHCNKWADAVKGVQDYVDSLSVAERELRKSIVDGVAEMNAAIASCHGESILDAAKDLEDLAQAGKWRRFKKEIEDVYSKRVQAKVSQLSQVPGALTQKTVSEYELIHDGIAKTFVDMIKNAEAELIERTPGGVDGLALKTTPVPVKHADDLTLREFVEEHAIPGKPVVIRGLRMINPDVPWTLEHIADVCGDVKVRLNTKSTTTTNWGGLVDAGRMPLNDFARQVQHNDTLRTWYLHDWSLNRYCPSIFGPPPYTEFTMPKYFAGDYFQRVPWIGYEQTWPSLFIGANATSSALHVDSGATNFWMYLMSGKKLWRFWDREQTFNLYHKPFTAHFRFRSFDVDLKRNPLLADAPMYEVVQEPGDLVFVPANSPHAVHNMDDITALSMNYVDATNLWLYLAGLVEDEAWEELEMFDVDVAPFGLVKGQKDVSFGEFKSQRVGWERANAEYRSGERFAQGERVPVWLD